MYTRVRYSMDGSIILYAEMNRRKKKKINLVYLVSIFFKNKGVKEKILFYIFAQIFFKFLKRIKIPMVFIIVVQFSLKNIKSIGLRWEIKKASIVSSNLGILAPVLERNCSSIKVIFFFFLRYWNLYELERYRFDYFVFMAKII